jgi:hypothetical protein
VQGAGCGVRGNGNAEVGMRSSEKKLEGGIIERGAYGRGIRNSEVGKISRTRRRPIGRGARFGVTGFEEFGSGNAEGGNF